MERINRISARSRLLLAALCLVLCAAAAIGAAFARYQTQKTVDMEFKAVESDALTITTGEWTPIYDEDDETNQIGYEMEFDVTNTGESALDFSVYLLASVGLQSSDNISVTFWMKQPGWVSYTGEAYRIREGGVIDLSFGDGWIYRTCRYDDALGDWVDRAWTLEAGQTVTGAVTIEQLNGFTVKDHVIQLRLAAYAQD